MAYYALTIFTGAFLLFLVQPLIGKYILPWFGGGPGVWTTCMLFFQVMLVGGYAYAHGVSRWLTPRRQVIAQLALLAASLAALPIIPPDAWKPSASHGPMLRILALLAATIALPYLALSSTGPLMQHWFALSCPGKSPYRLFALSNAGSLIALLGYPFYFESHFTRQTQARLWGAGLVLYALFTALAGWRLWRGARPRHDGSAVIPDRPGWTSVSDHKDPAPDAKQMNTASAEECPTAQRADENARAPRGWLRGLLWLLLPACASALLLAATNKLCLDVAVVPFLWVLPLAIYLLSFIVAFDSPRWYARFPFTLALILALGAFCWAMESGADWPVWRQALTYGLALFVCCVVCHGELYRLRPPPERLTAFYLLISIGGALGGLFVGVVAPAVFTDYYELHCTLLLCGVLFCVAASLDRNVSEARVWAWLGRILPLLAVAGLDRWLAHVQAGAQLNRHFVAGARWGLWLFLAALIVRWAVRRGSPGSRTPAFLWLGLGVCAMAAFLWTNARQADPDVTHKSRNFYGVLTVFNYRQTAPESHHYMLQHGRITHGLQFTDPDQSRWATTYFGQETGVGIAMRSLPQGPKKVGIVGLGTGTLAVYGLAGDTFRFYEINPMVEQIARSPFTYLSDCPARVEVARGDARLVMEREPAQGFDLLILDAFSSDSVPVHLLTSEAMALYGRHLKPGGILAVHISNHYLDLEPVVRKLAGHFHYHAALIDYEEYDEAWWVYSASWMLLSKDPGMLDLPLVKQAASTLKPLKGDAQLWTDDFASLFPILMRE